MHREMTETVAAATGQDNPGAVSEHDVNALATHQVDDEHDDDDEKEEEENALAAQ